MRLLTTALSALLLGTPAIAEPVTCPDLKQIATCLGDEASKWGEAEPHNLPEGQKLVLVQDKEASGAYNAVYNAYTYNGAELIALSQEVNLVNPDYDAENLIISSFNKGRGLADVGNIDFYRIDTQSNNLIKIQSFATGACEKVTALYCDESGKKDESGGYIERAGKYTRQMQYNLPQIEALSAE